MAPENLLVTTMKSVLCSCGVWIVAREESNNRDVNKFTNKLVLDSDKCTEENKNCISWWRIMGKGGFGLLWGELLKEMTLEIMSGKKETDVQNQREGDFRQIINATVQRHYVNVWNQVGEKRPKLLVQVSKRDMMKSKRWWIAGLLGPRMSVMGMWAEEHWWLLSGWIDTIHVQKDHAVNGL